MAERWTGPQSKSRLARDDEKQIFFVLHTPYVKSEET